MSNVVLNAGSGGATLGTDQVAGTPNVDYQIVKVGFSVAGSAPVQTSATNPLPIAQYLQGTAASVNTGNADAGTQRMVLATNQPTLSNAQPVTQSGSWTVSVNGVVADATAFTRGTTVQLPVGGVVEAAQSGLTVGQTRALSLTAGALLRVDASGVAVPVTGTFWQATQPVSAASLPLPTGAAADTSVNGILVAQGSTTSGEKGPLMQGAVTTGSPAYTTAQTSPISLDTSGNLRVNIMAGGITAGTAGSAATDVVTVQGIAGGTAVPVSGTVTANLGTVAGLALDTSVNGVLVAQGSTTSGEKGPLIQGAVTTGSPTYTTGQTSPLSLDTAGNLRVNIVAGAAAGGTSLADASAFTRGTTSETPVGGIAETSAPSLTTGKAAALSLNLSGGLRVDPSGVTSPVSLASLPALATGTNTIGALTAHQSTNVDQWAGTAVDVNSGVKSAGTLRVVIATDQPSLSNAQPVSQSGTWTVQPGNTANTTPWLTTNVPGTSPGSTVSRIKAAASTNSTNLKGSAGVVLGYALYNNTASAKFFKFYNKATAPTVGTDTPLFTVIIPASGGANVNWADGLPFATGIGYGITGAVTDADTTATAADDVHGMVLWK